MSTAILPTMPGIAWPVTRTMMDDVTIQSAISGKETRINNQSYPRYQFDLTYNILRSAAAYTEYQQLLGFINARYGRWDSFLYTADDDNSVSGQAIGTGDGATTVFQLLRTLNGFIEPVLAPNTVSAVKLNGATQSGSSYSVSNWGTSTPGILTFNSAPGSGVAITADFTYYWPCRFNMDKFAFSEFMSGMYELKKLSLITVKN
jgi:uncharacterized protein (TIGR02217 family)